MVFKTRNWEISEATREMFFDKCCVKTTSLGKDQGTV